MPKTTKYFVCGNNNLSQEESEVPSSPEDIESSDQELDHSNVKLVTSLYVNSVHERESHMQLL